MLHNYVHVLPFSHWHQQNESHSSTDFRAPSLLNQLEEVALQLHRDLSHWSSCQQQYRSATNLALTFSGPTQRKWELGYNPRNLTFLGTYTRYEPIGIHEQALLKSPDSTETLHLYLGWLACTETWFLSIVVSCSVRHPFDPLPSSISIIFACPMGRLILNQNIGPVALYRASTVVPGLGVILQVYSIARSK